jgi:FkbM family methyltransferase
MGIVSFAQNREDVRLARVLTAPSGFYIDVGAADPTTISVTRHFSDRGWHGINIEPRAAAAAALRDALPRDITLENVAGRTAGETTFFEMERPELGEVSTADPARAAELARTGHTLVERRLSAVTLAEVCEKYAPAVIDFLSIDVEGAEADVIAGADWRRFRPRIVIVESVQVITVAATHAEWEPMLLEAGYVFVVDDGINRFYVTREEAGTLAEPLARPVSWLDRYEPYEYLAEIERIQAEARAAIAAAHANGTGGATAAGGRASVAAQVLAEAAEAREQAMWASYEGLRAELVRLRQRIETYERQLMGREFSVSGSGTLGALAGPEGIGPIWLALAARATRLSRRYPGLSTKIKEQVVGVHRRVRRMRG